jgi:3-deoxy-D-manno-octulosonic-acid transferase
MSPACCASLSGTIAALSGSIKDGGHNLIEIAQILE